MSNETEEAKVTIDGTEYFINDMSEEAEAV